MKKTLLAALLVAGAASAFGQGAIGWGNSFTGFRSPIYGPDPANPSLSLSGASALSSPTGSTVYGGPLLQGAGWSFGLYYGAVGAPVGNLTLLTSTTFRTSTGNALPAGLVNGGTITVPGFAAGSQIEFQIRVWDNAGGTLTYGEAVAQQRATGTSTLITSAALGGIDPNTGAPVGTPSTIGWTSFNVSAVPEPTSFALAGLGAAAMLIFRRRK